MRVAVYSSVLYGSDFIRESIISVLPYVDRVFVVIMDRPWGGTEGVIYKGEWVGWPDEFDDTRALLAGLPVEVISASKFSPWNRWGFAFELVQKHCKPEEVVFLDPDCVFSENEADRAFGEWKEHREYEWAQPGQIELWRTPAWQITRPRSMVWFARGDLSLVSRPDPPMDDGITRPKMHNLAARVHNLGFCVSEQSMKWKHLTSMAFSPVIKESIPNPDWYETKWLRWAPWVGDLEISIGCESAIPRAVPYDTTELPASIKRRYDAGEWPHFGEP